MAKNPQKQDQDQEHIISSKRHFHWTKKVGNEDSDEEKPSKITTKTTVSSKTPHKKLSAIAISRLRSILTTFNKNRLHSSHPQSPHLGARVVGTLFGHRRGHVHFAFQTVPNSRPAFLIELDTPISGLVKEMASGLVRIALECDKKNSVVGEKKGERKRLLEERVWRSYCNGKKCGFASRRECGEKEWKVLKSVEPISMGAGVLPGDGDGDDEIMYMRAKFERVVGSRDSEAFYMMNPDSNGAPELSIYLLRV